MKNNEEKVINDLVYFKNLKIVQNKKYFNFSLDSILLPNFVRISPKTKRIMDICTGNAPIPLVLSTFTSAKIYGIEIQKEVFELAEESIKINNIKNVELINDDIKEYYKKLETDSYDIITCNPPYFKYKKESILNDDIVKSIARHEIYITLEDIIVISKKLLKNGGSLYLIHRTERLMEILEKMKKNNIEPKRIRFVYPKINSESNLVLIEGQKNGKTGLKILNPLYVHKDNGEYTDEVLKMFGSDKQ